ncbi:MAG: hypothetical protein JKY34_14420 [Kordiimonadaceae bacterium]|nr:hypothetical protein [Kordiimonadaceae bacterium]
MSMKICMVALVFYFAVEVGVTAEQVPFTQDEYGRLYLPVSTHPPSEHILLFDSGAGRSAIIESDTVLMGAKLYRKGKLRHLASSGFRHVPFAYVKNMTVGGVEVNRHIVALYPFSLGSIDVPVRGLVGFDVFRGYLLHIRQIPGFIETYTTSAYLDRKKWGLLTGWPNDNASILSSFMHDGIEISVLLATGYSHSAVNSLAYEIFKATPGATKGPVIKVARGMGNSTGTFRSLNIKNLTVKNWAIGDVTVARIRLNTQMLTGYMNTPLLVLGADVLMAQDVIFDFRAFQLWYPIEQSVKPSAVAAVQN